MSAGTFVKNILSAKTREKRVEILNQVPKHLRGAVKQTVEKEFENRRKKRGTRSQ